MSFSVNVCLSVDVSLTTCAICRASFAVLCFCWFSLLFLTSAVFFQGDIVNNIEQNVSKSVDHVTVAKEQTKKAIKYQTKARKVNFPSTFCV